MSEVKDIYEFEEELIGDDIPFVDNEEQSSGWTIRDIMTAEHAIKSYKSLEFQVAQAKEIAEQYVKQAEQTAKKYLAAVNSPKERQMAYLENNLRLFANDQRKGTRKKSIKLVNGTLSFTSQQPKFERDEEVILDFISGLEQDNPLRQFLKPQPDKLNWKDLKSNSTVKIVDDESKMFAFGQEIPSVKIVEVDESFKIK